MHTKDTAGLLERNEQSPFDRVHRRPKGAMDCCTTIQQHEQAGGLVRDRGRLVTVLYGEDEVRTPAQSYGRLP